MLKKNNWWKPQNGVIATCTYCGEQVGNSKKYCTEHKTQAGRKETFEAQTLIIKERQEAGLPVQSGIKNWK